MLAICKNEFRRYFITPIGYVFMGAFLLMSGLLFFFYNLTYASGEVLGLFTDMTSFLMFLIPVLTMRTFAEERKNRSDQFLITSPVSMGAIVGGKFMAAVGVYLITLLLTFVYVAIIAVFGKVYWGEVLVGYTGFFLLSCCYIASGILVSALCENQVSAAVLTFGVHFMFSAIDWLIQSLPVGVWQNTLGSLSLFTRYIDVEGGSLTLTSLVYFLSVTILFVYATVLVLRARRWRKL